LIEGVCGESDGDEGGAGDDSGDDECGDGETEEPEEEVVLAVDCAEGEEECDKNEEESWRCEGGGAVDVCGAGEDGFASLFFAWVLGCGDARALHRG